MLKVLFFLLLVLAAAVGFAWLADNPGNMILQWRGQQVETSLMVALAGLVALIAAVMLVWWLIKAVVRSPGKAGQYFKGRRRDRGYEALSTGMIAAGAGDSDLARRSSRQAMKLLDADREPLLRLLDAQAAMIDEDHDAARRKFDDMAQEPGTRLLGLRGLYLEAARLHHTEAARQYAEKAAMEAPHLPWAAQATLEFKSREGDWDGALAMLDNQRKAKIVTKADADRKQAVIKTAKAMDLLDSDAASASRTAQEAHRLDPSLVPAAVTAAKALFQQGDVKKGARILEKTWKKTPHPEIADAYLHARAGDSARDRLARARKLEQVRGNNPEALLAVAQAALDSRELDLARTSAEQAARMIPRESAYLLLAEIEEADTGDHGRIRHWLSQAVKAPRDPAWTADGIVSQQWAPVSPVTGRLDAFEWKVPVEQLAGPVEEGAADTYGHGDADAAIAALPPVARTSNLPVVQEADKSDISDVVTPKDTASEGDTKSLSSKPDKAKPEPAPVADVIPLPSKTTIIPPAPTPAENTGKDDLPATDGTPAKPENATASSISDNGAPSGPPAHGAAPSGDDKKLFPEKRPDDPGVKAGADQHDKKKRFGIF